MREARVHVRAPLAPLSADARAQDVDRQQHHFSSQVSASAEPRETKSSTSIGGTESQEPRPAFASRMCGEDVDLDDGGSAEEEKEEEEEFWSGDAVKMLPPPPVAHSEGSAWGSRRGRCGCVACGAALVLWNLCVISASALLLVAVFCVVLLPAVLLLYAGFLCHSRVLNSPSAICRYLDDNSCSALIILGFVMMSPLVVVAAAVFCGLIRRYRLLLFIQPIRRARFRGRLWDWVGSIHAWV